MVSLISVFEWSSRATYLSQRSWWYAGAIYLLNSLKRSLNCDNAFLTLRFQPADGRWYEYPNPGPSIFRNAFYTLTFRLRYFFYPTAKKFNNTTYDLIFTYFFIYHYIFLLSIFSKYKIYRIYDKYKFNIL